MKRLWERFSGWFDARKPREQWVVAVASVVVVAALADTLVFSPAMSRRREAERAIEASHAQMRQAQVQLQAAQAVQENDPNAVIRARIAELRREAEQMDLALRSRSSEFVTPDRVRPLLERLLAGRPTLQLVELRTIDAVPLQPAPGRTPKPEPAAAPGAAAVQPASAGAQPGLFRHGLEIAVRGSYADLVEYLRDLEKLPVRVYWGRIDLVADTWPNSVLRLTLHTLSLDRTWLAV